MPEVRRLRKRGATIEVVAYGEILFADGADVPRFLKRFSAKVRDFAAQEAPANKRPRWAHYGKPLKATMKARTQIRRGKSLFHLHSAAGSTAPYAYYVDQGTGVFNGGGPYKAEILPPWTEGSPSLYEASWRPNLANDGTGNKVSSVYIKGQVGKQFFDKALARAFAFMRLSSFQRPGEGVGGVSSVLRSEPFGLTDFLGNTPTSGSFQAQLEEWRSWRDAAWNNFEGLGRGRGIGSRFHREDTANGRGQVEFRSTAAERRRLANMRAERERRQRDEEGQKVRAAAARARKSKETAKQRAERLNAMAETDRLNRLKRVAQRKINALARAGARDFTRFEITRGKRLVGYRIEYVTKTGKSEYVDVD